MSTPTPPEAERVTRVAGPAPRPEPLPRQIGRYEVVREVGRGGMAVVYEARDRTLGRTVAIKVLCAGEGASVLADRLRREARVAAHLRHPAILMIHEIGELAGEQPGETLHYIVMDFVDGQTLADALADGMSIERRIAVIAAAARAAGHAHRHGVVHRDLKPSNVMLTREGAVRLTDFGLARWDAREALRLTHTGELLGTVAYMAPEQVRCERALGPATDVWALGVMLHEALGGRLPFAGETAAQMMVAIEREAPRPLIGAPAALEGVCGVALAKAPRHRYADGEAFADDLERWQTGEAVHARPAHPGRRLRRTIGGLLLLLLLLAAAGAWHRQRSRDQRRAGLAAQARQAADAGRWEEALALCIRGLALGDDPALVALASRCEAARSAAALRDQARQRRRTDARAGERALRPLRRMIEETRALTYRRDGQLRQRVDGLVAALEALARRLDGPAGARAEAWQLLGGGWLLVGDLARAERALDEAARRAPDDGLVQYQLGRLHLRRSLDLAFDAQWHPKGLFDRRHRRHVEAARDAFEKASARGGPARPLDRHLALAYLALAQRRWPVLSALCREGAVKFDGQLGVEEYDLLRGWRRQGQARLTAWDALLERRPQDARLIHMRGGALAKLGRQADALADYDRALALNPHIRSLHHHRSVILARMGRPAEALSGLDAALGRWPRWSMLWAERGLLLIHLGRREAGLSSLATAHEIAPDAAQVHHARGWAFQLHGDAEGAIAAYTRAIALDPGCVHALWQRAELRLAKGDPRAALADLARAASAAPRDPLIYRRRAEVFLAQGHPRRALRELDIALRLAPEDGEIWAKRGSIELRQMNVARARQDLDRALRLAPELLHARINRGLARQLSKDPSGAERDFDRALAIDDNEPSAYLNRALARLDLGRAADAERDCDVGLRLRPGHAKTLAVRGQARERQGRHAEALADYRAASAAEPDRWKYAVAAGQLACRLGQRERGLADLRRGKRLAPVTEQESLEALIRRYEN